jgi:pimeloyl-[acyl-carrier protein] methyl ester esterase
MSSTPQHSPFERAERALFHEYGVGYENRRVHLAHPALGVRVLEAGDGTPVVIVHGSGMSASTWAPLLAALDGRRAYCVDLPGFGLSEPYDYRGRLLREHAVVQMTSLLDALGLDRAPVVGTSLGAMWALCLALDRPERVSAVVGLGVPAVAFAGMRGDPFFRAMTTPGVRSVVRRVPAPRDAAATRKAMAKVLGPGALERTPDTFFEVVREGMRVPGWKWAMSSHLNLAMRRGTARPENVLSDEELRSIEVPVQMIFGDADVYGAPEIGERAVAHMPDARLEVIPGGHAPFLDDPERCAALIERISATSSISR